MPWVAIASPYARSRVPSSTTVVPMSPKQARVGTGTASAPWPAGRSPARERLVVGGGGLGPQVQLGPVGLDLAPDGEAAQGKHGHDDQQLLHDGNSFRGQGRPAATASRRSARPGEYRA